LKGYPAWPQDYSPVPVRIAFIVRAASSCACATPSYLERERANASATVNQALIAIHSLFRFIAGHVPERVDFTTHVQAVPLRRVPRPAVPYLENAEIGALLATPVRRTTARGQARGRTPEGRVPDSSPGVTVLYSHSRWRRSRNRSAFPPGRHCLISRKNVCPWGTFPACPCGIWRNSSVRCSDTNLQAV